MLRIFGHFVPAATVALGIAEASLIVAIFDLLFLYLSGASASQMAIGSGVFSLAFSAVIVLIMHASGLYHLDALVDIRNAAFRATLVLILVGVMAAAVTMPMGDMSLVHLSQGQRWQWIAQPVAGWLACIMLTRTIFVRVARTGMLRRRVLVLGQGPRATRLRELAKERFGAYFLPVAQTASEPRVSEMNENSDGEIQTINRVESVDLLRLALDSKASEIVIASDDRRGLPVDQLLQCRLSGIRVTEYLDFYERESGRVDLSALRPSWFIFSDGFRTGFIVDSIKRSFDVLVSLLTLIVIFPVMALTAIAIKLEDRGDILFRQERVGLRGKTFLVYKFRSMEMNAEAEGAPVWAAKSDPRVTWVGSIIRKLRIDELPQLYNVFRGDMSFVGPRPERPYFVNRLTQHIPFYNERHSVKPGITGWAQVNYPYGASMDDAQQKLAYDLYYLKNRGIFLDLIILIRTVRVVLWPDGAR